MVDAKLLDCFKHCAPPAPKPGQTYQPCNESWFELQFFYKVEIPADTSRVSADSILFGDRSEPFFRVKEDLQADPNRWGVYRKDWFGTIDHGVYNWYFMEASKAMEFRLWVNL